MASMSEEMRTKRDVKRKASVLVVDKDLGNMGLYKAMLSAEYEIDCINNISVAMELFKSKNHNAVVLDEKLGQDEIIKFLKWRDENADLKEGNMDGICLVLTEGTDRDKMVLYGCYGVVDFIPKPFTKEGMSEKLYSTIRGKRHNDNRKKVLVIDDDIETLKTIKGYLGDKYDVVITNCAKYGHGCLMNNKTDLLIADVRMPEMSGVDVCTLAKQKQEKKYGDVPVLFMTDMPDADVINKCAEFKPEGFLVKPLEKEMLLSALDRIFIMESYMTKTGRKVEG